MKQKEEAEENMRVLEEEARTVETWTTVQRQTIFERALIRYAKHIEPILKDNMFFDFVLR
jgi:hypothetical protein